MDIKDALDIMNSDFKLWEKATSKDLGNGKVQKTINLPWGIGDYVVELEGMHDAGKRRQAVGAYGQHLRGLIKERIDDDAITGRAKAAAARSEYADSTDSDSLGADQGLRDPQLQAQAVQGAGEAHEADVEDNADLGEELTARRTAVNGRIEVLTASLAKLCKELRGIDAALAAMVEEDADE